MAGRDGAGTLAIGELLARFLLRTLPAQPLTDGASTREIRPAITTTARLLQTICIACAEMREIRRIRGDVICDSAAEAIVIGHARAFRLQGVMIPPKS